MDALVVIGLAVLVAAAALAFSGWRRGRPRLPGISGDTSEDNPEPDTWHGDPRDRVVERPAGSDAESMVPPTDHAAERRGRHGT